MLEARDIQKNYGNLAVLKGVSLHIPPGKLIALVGSSGAGKSTLLQIMGTLDTPDSGTLTYEGTDVLKWDEKKKASFRNRTLGFVFQFHHLLPEFTALENVCMPAWIGGGEKEATLQKAEALLQKVNLGHRLHHKPSELSGGEQQRVSIARALINNPSLILADEPTGNLDSQNGEEIFDLLYTLTGEMKVGVLIATHNMFFAEKAHSVVRITDGFIQQEG